MHSIENLNGDSFDCGAFNECTPDITEPTLHSIQRGLQLQRVYSIFYAFTLHASASNHLIHQSSPCRLSILICPETVGIGWRQTHTTHQFMRVVWVRHFVRCIWFAFERNVHLICALIKLMCKLPSNWSWNIWTNSIHCRTIADSAKDY